MLVYNILYYILYILYINILLQINCIYTYKEVNKHSYKSSKTLVLSLRPFGNPSSPIRTSSMRHSVAVSIVFASFTLHIGRFCEDDVPPIVALALIFALSIARRLSCSFHLPNLLCLALPRTNNI